MQIKDIAITALKEYERNPRLNDAAVDAVAASIREFGFKVPIVVDKHNVIVCGHTRVKAARQLMMTTVPCIVADDLTDEQIKAFRLADNKVAELAEWDYDLLNAEIENLLDFDMEEFGFELFDQDEAHETNAARTQDRVENICNLGIAQFAGEGKYDIPKLRPVYELPPIKEWIGFNYVLSDDNPEGKAVHFFIDDYQFERIWNEPERYIEKLSQYAAVATPDFSPYGDMPNALQIYNHYRKHWVGCFMQQHGITVIPTIRASTDERSFEWYLDGEPSGGIVMISSMWTKDEEQKKAFLREYNTMYERLNPSKVLVYGKIPSGLTGDYEQIESFAASRFAN